MASYGASGRADVTISLLEVLPMKAASGPLSGKAYYLHWGVVQISLANFVIVLVMLALFAAALLLPFPGSKPEQRDEDSDVER
jgi:hypothetical protein